MPGRIDGGDRPRGGVPAPGTRRSREAPVSPSASYCFGQGLPVGGSPFSEDTALSASKAMPDKHDHDISQRDLRSDAQSTSAAVSSGGLSRQISRRLSIMSEPTIPEEDIAPDVQGITFHWPSIKMELQRTASLAIPLLINNVASFGLSIIVLAYVGHLGSKALACATLGGSLFNVLGQSLFIGAASTLETLCGQAVGAGKYKLLGLEMIRCMLLMTLSMPIFAVVYLNIGSVLIAMGQELEVATGAAVYLKHLLPALWLMGMTECLKRGLLARSIVLPNMAIAIFTTVCMPFYSWLFIAHLGLGFVGAAYAVNAGYLSNLLCFLCTWLAINWRSYGTTEYAWPGWTWDMCKGLPVILQLAFPTTMMICLDWWTWETMILLGGLLPNPDVSVAVMGLGFNVVVCAFMVPMAVTATTTIGIANFLGANQPRRARLAQLIGLGTTVALVSLISVLLWVFKGEIGRIYTNDSDVLQELATIMPIIAFILWLDGIQNSFTAPLRGSGRQAVGATINLSALWLFGVPLSAVLAFYFKLGVTGMWIGLLLAFAVQAVAMLTTVSLVINMELEAARAQLRLLGRPDSADVGDDLQAPLINTSEDVV